MVEEEEANLFLLILRQIPILVDRGERAEEHPVDVGSPCEELSPPLARVRGPRPQRSIDMELFQYIGPAADETPLTRLCAETLPVKDNSRPIRGLAPSQFIVDRPAPDDPHGRSIIAGYPWFAKKRDWQREIKRLLDNGFKLEVEALISKDISYVTEVYTPARLKERDWLD